MYLPQLQTVALRKHGTLRKSCDEYIKKLHSEKKQRSRIQSADTYFEPFRIACQTKHPDVHVSLNGIQNLVAGGYLTGERMVKINNEDTSIPLIDVIVKQFVNVRYSTFFHTINGYQYIVKFMYLWYH